MESCNCKVQSYNIWFQFFCPRIYIDALNRFELDLRQAAENTGIAIFCDDRLDRAWANDALSAIKAGVARCACPKFKNCSPAAEGQLFATEASSGECCFGCKPFSSPLIMKYSRVLKL